MNTKVVTEYLNKMIAKQVEEFGLVVWYDPEKVYAEVLDELDFPDTTVLCYDGSFIKLRREIDRRKLLDGEEPPHLVIYVPLAHEETHYALIELEAAGVIMQPGQQPVSRNTRLSLVARNALQDILGEETVIQVEKQTEAGKLSLTDLNALAKKGRGISEGILALVFGTGNPQEITLLFLASDRFDENVIRKNAQGDLEKLFSSEYGIEIPPNISIVDVRRRLTRYILLSDFMAGLAGHLPDSISSIPVAVSSSHVDACVKIACDWRRRRDIRDSYVTAAHRVERDLGICDFELDPKVIEDIETFSAVEKALLVHTEKRLLVETDNAILNLAESRLSRFWCDVEPNLQARWALVASIALVLLEADRVQKEAKTPPTSLNDMISAYADEPAPWCRIDTCHRHMESRWHNFEPTDGECDTIEKLVVKARQHYAETGSQVTRCFLERLLEGGPAKGMNNILPDGGALVTSFLYQTQIFDKFIKPALNREKVAYVWVDALRFEMGRELTRLMREDLDIDLHIALAATPTVTEIGMAALLPGVHGKARVISVSGGKLALEINGTTVKDRKDRVAFLRRYAGVEVSVVKLDDLLPKPNKRIRESIENAQFILVTSQEIDELCERDNITQARRQMDGILNDLRRGVRILSDLGIQRIVMTADHGYLFGEELSEDMKVEVPGGETAELNRRVWVGRGGSASDAFVRVPLKALGMLGDFDVATPWTFGAFKCKGGSRAYFHGGLSPQELIVPVMTIIPPKKKDAGTLPGIDWTLTPGSRKLSTRFFSVQIDGVNRGLFENSPPRVRVELRAKGKTMSQAVSASYGFDEATGDVVLRKDEADRRKIAPNTVTLMVHEDPAQKYVSLFLLDAATGIELSRLENIEVAISM